MNATTLPTGTALVDGLRTRYANGRYLADRIPGSELTVLTARHFAWEEIPGEFASMVADWVARAETARSGPVS
jgi:pimeloyl-ACP methyl ester carboxylesterase